MTFWRFKRQLRNDISAGTGVLLILQLDTLTAKVDDMAKTLAEFQTDLQARIDKLTADVAAQTSIDASIKTLLADQSTQLAALRQEVADLQAQGVDASVLQPLLDKFDAQTTALEAATADLAAAVPQNTTPTAADQPAGT